MTTAGEAKPSGEDLAGLEGRARSLLSPGAFAYVAAGAGDEQTVADNASAWRSLRLRPRVLRGVGAADTGTTLLGRPVASPIVVAPTGRHRVLHPDGELATSAGSAAAGCAYVVSAYATEPLESVAQAAGESPTLWFQLSLHRHDDEVPGLCRRARQAGYRAIVVTVDEPVPGSSRRARRHPLDFVHGETHANFRGAPAARVAWNDDAWPRTRPVGIADLAGLVATCGLPVIVKGIVRADDARRCLDAGAAALIVSNHGGRHLEGSVATASALPEVIAATAGGEVYVDGGISSGVDVLRAIALGARGVLVGRLPLWGLTTGGQLGVHRVLEQLRRELSRTMIQCGAASLAEVTSDLLEVGRP